MTQNILKIAGDRPVPFIICSDNWATKRLGATVVLGPDNTPAIVDASFPIANLIDGSRATYMKATKISGRTRGFVYLRFDLSATSFGSSADNRIEIVMLENDLNYPCRVVSVQSYTANDYSTGEVKHGVSVPTYQTINGKKVYVNGMNPMIDMSYVVAKHSEFNWDDFGDTDYATSALDGRFAFIFLADVIESDHPYIEVQLRETGKNIFGLDGTFDNGLWDSAFEDKARTTRLTFGVVDGNNSDQSGQTADPPPDAEGSIDFYIDLTALTRNVTTEWIEVGLTPGHKYLLSFKERKTGLDVLGTTHSIEFSLSPDLTDTTPDEFFVFEYNGKVYFTDTKDLFVCNYDGSHLRKINATSFIGCKAFIVYEGFAYCPTIDATIRKINLIDGTHEDIITGETNLFGCSVHTVDAKLYYTVAGAIKKCNLDGSSPEIVITALPLDPRVIVVDSVAGFVYYCRNDKVMRITDAGASRNTMVDLLNDCRGLTLDIANTEMYYTEKGDNRFWKANMDGTSQTKLNTGLQQPTSCSYAPDSNRIFWAELSASALRFAQPDTITSYSELIHTQKLRHEIYRNKGSEHLGAWGTKHIYLYVDGAGRLVMGDSNSSPVIFCLKGSGEHRFPIPSPERQDDFGRDLHKVYFRFKVHQDDEFSVTPTKWELDDISLKSMDLPYLPSDYETLTLPGRVEHFPQGSIDFDGRIQVKRIGFYGYTVGLSAAKNKNPYLQDNASNVGIITSNQILIAGGTMARNSNNDAVALYIPTSGIKQEWNIQSLGSIRWMQYLEQLLISGKIFGWISPLGDFGNYVIVPNSFSYKGLGLYTSITDATPPANPSPDASRRTNTGYNELQQATLVLKEV